MTRPDNVCQNKPTGHPVECFGAVDRCLDASPGTVADLVFTHRRYRRVDFQLVGSQLVLSVLGALLKCGA